MNADERPTSGPGATFEPESNEPAARASGSGAPVSQPQRTSLRPASGEVPRGNDAGPSRSSAFAPVSSPQPTTAQRPASASSPSPASGAFTPRASASAPTTAAPQSAPATTRTAPAPVVPDHSSANAASEQTATAGGVGAIFGTGVDKLRMFTAKATEGSAAAQVTPAPRADDGPRKVRVMVSRLDPLSALKIGFLLSIALGIMTVVAVYVLWVVLNSMEVFGLVEAWIADLFTDQELNLLQFVDLNRWMSAAILIAVLNVVMLTALSGIGAMLYNTVSRIVGGVYVTLTDD